MARNIHDKSSVENNILLSMAFKNLIHKKFRTSLTLFGIAIGIGSIYFLLSFGLGLQHLVTNEVIGSQSIKTIEVNSPNSKIIKLDDITTERLKNIPNVDQLGKSYYFPGSIKISGSESDTIVYGIDKGFEDLTYLNVIKGNLPSKSNDSNSVVLNQASLQAIGLSDHPESVLGKQVKINVPLSKSDKNLKNLEKDFTVVGVINSGSGSEIFIKDQIFKDLGVSYLTQVKIGVKNVDDISSIRTQVESFGLETSSPVDTLNEINSIFRYLNFILIGFGGIGMIIAILGMLNTLTISLLERTKEIGLMVALGARSIDMRLLFMFEALLLSCFGALLGILSSIILGKIVNLIMNIYARGRGLQTTFDLFSNPWWLILGSLVFMILVGFIVVYLPAKRAEKISAIDALRRE